MEEKAQIIRTCND